MPTREPKILRDGWTNLLGGSDSERTPNLLADNQVAFLENATLRGGYAQTRPRFSQEQYTFPNSEVETWFATQLHQGSETYEPDGYEPFKVLSVGGRLFKLDILNNFTISEITPTKATATTTDFTAPAQGASITISVSFTDDIEIGYPLTIVSGVYTVTAKTDTTITVTNVSAEAGVLVASGSIVTYLAPNPPNFPQVWMLQADEYLFVQDGQSPCIIFDGASARQSLGLLGDMKEIPPGKQMEFWRGRVFVAVNEREIIAGDISGGPTKVYQFTETGFFAEGGKFRVRDPINCLKEISSQDSAEAEGPLLIGTTKRVYSLDLPTNRDLWKDLQTPILPARLISFGPLSQNGSVLVNGDIYFRAIDGLRSFIIARRNFGVPGNTPISREMNRILIDDDIAALKFGSGVLFDNRLLFTVRSQPLKSCSAYWKGIGVLNFDGISSMGQKSPPVYDMLWTGCNPMQLTTISLRGQERCFCFAINSTTLVNEIWEIHKESGFDNVDGRIVSVLESRSLVFGDPKSLNKLEAFEMWVDQLKGIVDFELEWRPDRFPCWFAWGAAQRCAAIFCNDPTVCEPMREYKEGYDPRIAFPQPPDDIEAFTNRPARIGYEFQLRLTWTGHARILMGLAKAFIPDELPNNL